MEPEIIRLGTEIEWIGSSGNRLLRLARIINNLRKRPADILQSSHFYTNLYAGLAGKLLNIPTIGAIRNDVVSEITCNRSFGKWQLTLPHSLIANSQAAVDRAVSLGIRPERLHFVRNVVEVKGVSEKRHRTATDRASRVNILFAGRLVQQKNPELFVRLASRLVKDLPMHRLTFQMAGQGPMLQGLKHLVKKCALQDNEFMFLGPQPDMNPVYRGVDVLVLTSSHEGTPNVVLEAMAHRIPVVATRVGGLPEIVSDERGLLVEVSDFKSLCSETARLITNPELRRQMGQNSLDYVTKEHSLGYLEERLNEIYSGLTGGPRIGQ